MLLKKIRCDEEKNKQQCDLTDKLVQLPKDDIIVLMGMVQLFQASTRKPSLHSLCPGCLRPLMVKFDNNAWNHT